MDAHLLTLMNRCTSSVSGVPRASVLPLSGNLADCCHIRQCDKERKGKGYIAVPACGGSLAEAKKTVTRKGEGYTAAPACRGQLSGSERDSVTNGWWSITSEGQFSPALLRFCASCPVSCPGTLSLWLVLARQHG
eukprot:1138717-Pelagomonas_calceolata.AAC.2